jgi:hypothetical protein
MGVTDMLVLAAAAFSEEPAEGLTSQRGFPFHGLRYGFHIIFFLPQDLYLNPVPGSCERDEDNFPIDPPHPAAAINHFFDFEGKRTIHLYSPQRPQRTPRIIFIRKYNHIFAFINALLIF